MKRGKLIVIEGIDGSGKTTQIELLKKAYEELGVADRFHFTKEPTDSEIGKELRKMLSAPEGTYSNSDIATTFLADRIHHNVNPTDGIKKYLNEGINVVCDRYYYSNLVYQGFDEYYDWVKDMNFNCPDIEQPDILIYIDVDPKEACKRIHDNRDNTEVYENIEKLIDVRHKYYKLMDEIDPAIHGGKLTICIIPQTYTIDEMHNLILYIVSENTIVEKSDLQSGMITIELLPDENSLWVRDETGSGSKYHYNNKYDIRNSVNDFVNAHFWIEDK